MSDDVLPELRTLARRLLERMRRDRMPERARFDPVEVERTRYHEIYGRRSGLVDNVVALHDRTGPRGASEARTGGEEPPRAA